MYTLRNWISEYEQLIDPSPDISKYDCRHQARREECLIERTSGQKICKTSSSKEDTSTASLRTSRENGAWNCSEKDNFKITVNSSGRFLMNTAISVTVDFNPQHMSEVGVKCIDDNTSVIKSSDSAIKSPQHIPMGEYYSQGTFIPQRECSQSNCGEKWDLWHHSKANDLNKKSSSQSSPAKKRTCSLRNGMSPNKRRKLFSPQKNKIYDYFVRTDDIKVENGEESSKMKNVSLFHSHIDEKLNGGNITKHYSSNEMFRKGVEKHCSDNSNVSDVIVISSDEEDLPISVTKEEKTHWLALSNTLDLCDETPKIPECPTDKEGQNVCNSIKVSNSSTRNNIDNEVFIISSDEEYDDNLCVSSHVIDLTGDDLCSSDDAGGVIVPESNNFKKSSSDMGYDDDDDDDDDDCVSVISYQPGSISQRTSCEEVVYLKEMASTFSLEKENCEKRDCEFSTCANLLTREKEEHMECEERSLEDLCSKFAFMSSLEDNAIVIDSSLDIEDGYTTDSSLPSPPRMFEEREEGMLGSQTEENNEVTLCEGSEKRVNYEGAVSEYSKFAEKQSNVHEENESYLPKISSPSFKMNDKCIPSFDEIIPQCSGRESSEEQEGDVKTDEEENEESNPKIIRPSAMLVRQVQAEVLLSKLNQPWIDLETDEVPQCCIMGPVICNSLHGKKEVCPEETDYFDEHLILRLDCGTSAVDLLQSRLDLLVYPSTSVVQNLLFGCMNLWVEGVNDALSWLRQLLRLHPPCAFGMLEYYRKVLFDPVKDMRAPDGMFWFCVTKIEETMDAIEKQSREDNVAMKNCCVKQECSDVIQTFLESVSPSLSSEKEVLDLKHSDKLKQLLDTLDYLICIMEADLNMGLLKNISNLKRYICKTSRPLIAVAMWGTHGNVGNVNTKCRYIMKMYLRIFESYRDVGYHRNFKRLISLMAGVTYASERNSEPPKYPNIESNCKDFAGTFASIMMTTAFNMVEVRQILESSRPDWFRVCVCSNLIAKLYGRNMELSLQPVSMLLKSLHALNEAYPLDKEMFETLLAEPDTNIPKEEDMEELSPQYVKLATKKDGKGETRLHIACRRNNIKEVERLLRVPNISINEKDNEGWTPLHEASFHGSVECVKKLLSFRTPSGGPAVDLLAKSNAGVTPLMDAVSNGHLEVASVLLQYGGVKLLSEENNNGVSVWDLASTEDMKYILTSAQNHGQEYDLLTIPRTLYVKLAVLTPLTIKYYIQFSEVTKIVHYLKYNTELSQDGASLVKFQPIAFKKDFLEFKKLQTFLKKMSNNHNKLLDSLTFFA